METEKEEEIQIVRGNVKMTVRKIFKICIIGDTNVGKTSVLRRFVDNVFNPKTKNTIGVDFSILTMKYKDTTFKVQIWDTAGQERFRSITSNYLKSCDGYIMVFDINSKKTFENLDYWAELVDKFGSEESVKVVIGNKCDLENTVEQEDIAKKYGEDKFAFFKTSAKEETNIREVFGTIVRKILDNLNENGPREEERRLSFDSSTVLKVEKNKCAC